MEKKLALTMGSTLGLTTGYGTPDFRVFSMLSFVGPPVSSIFSKKAEPASEGVAFESTPNGAYVRLEGGEIVVLRPIHFETNSHKIKEESLPIIEAVAKLMLGTPNIRHVVVKGHTDSRGSSAYNRDLSNRRSNEVVRQLLNLQVEPSRLSAQGWGEMQPEAEEKSDQDLAQNRRVEFFIVKVGQLEGPMKEPAPRLVEKNIVSKHSRF